MEKIRISIFNRKIHNKSLSINRLVYFKMFMNSILNYHENLYSNNQKTDSLQNLNISINSINQTKCYLDFLKY